MFINKILFCEGNYLNGSMNGYGKKFDIYGKIKYEGEFVNGIKNGRGKEYNKNGVIIYEGKYINNKKVEL